MGVGENEHILLIILETSRSSAYFWFPVPKGGSGAGDDYRESNGSYKAPDWVRRDGAGAGWGMVCWGMSGLFVAGPVGGGAGFLYGAISGAVGGSMIG